MKDETYCCEDFAGWVKEQVYHGSGTGTWLMVSYLKTTRYVTLHYCPSCGQKLGESGSLMANIIIPGKTGRYGKTRSEHEENLRKDWGGSMSEEQLDKLKFMERKRKEKFGFDKQFVGQEAVDEYFRKTQGHKKTRSPEEMRREAERLQNDKG
jgi:hypothetical protein